MVCFPTGRERPRCPHEIQDRGGCVSVTDAGIYALSEGATSLALGTPTGGRAFQRVIANNAGLYGRVAGSARRAQVGSGQVDKAIDTFKSRTTQGRTAAVDGILMQLGRLRGRRQDGRRAADLQSPG